MRHILALTFALTGLLAGCTAPSSDLVADETPPVASGPDATDAQPSAQPATPSGEPAQKDFFLVPGQTESMTIDFQGGKLSGKVVTTGATSYTGFKIEGAGDCGQNVVSINIAIGGNNSVGFSCGDVAAGQYTLTWSIAAGVAMGTLHVHKATLVA